MLLYHGVLAPNAPWRREVVARAEPEPRAVDPSPRVPANEQAEEGTPPRMRPKYRAWADLMRRAFEADVLACARCGGRMTVLATIDDPAVIHRILTHLGLSGDGGAASPRRGRHPRREPASRGDGRPFRSARCAEPHPKLGG